jgi:hypothetical protein
MVDAFATVEDLELRLNRDFTAGAETEWITALLEDASTYLRDDVLGLQVFPQSTSTFRAWPDGGRVDMPQQPVISIDSVERDGVALVEDSDYTRRDSTLTFRTDLPVDITFTYGYETAPESLKRWTCVLVSRALTPLEAGLGLTVGGLSSVAIDDFKAAFADAGEMTGMTLSDRNIALIREQFGVGGSHVVTTR